MQHPFVQTRIGCAISGAADSIYGVSLKWCSIILEAVPPYISSNFMLACLFSASAFSVILALRTNMVLTPQTWNEQGAIHYLPLNFNPTFPFQSQRKSVTRARGSRDLRPRVTRPAGAGRWQSRQSKRKKAACETEKPSAVLEKRFSVPLSDIASFARGWNARCTPVQRWLCPLTKRKLTVCGGLLAVAYRCACTLYGAKDRQKGEGPFRKLIEC